MSSFADRLNAKADREHEPTEPSKELHPVALDVEVLDYRPKPAGTMFGFGDFRLSFNSGCVVEVFDCSLHEKEDKHWVNLPSKQFKKHDGSNGYSKMVIFDPSLMAAFQATVFEKLEAYVEGGGRG